MYTLRAVTTDPLVTVLVVTAGIMFYLESRPTKWCLFFKYFTLTVSFKLASFYHLSLWQPSFLYCITHRTVRTWRSS